MSGNEPTWNEDEQELPSFSEEESQSIYGAPSAPAGPLWEPDATDSPEPAQLDADSSESTFGSDTGFRPDPYSDLGDDDDDLDGPMEIHAEDDEEAPLELQGEAEPGAGLQLAGEDDSLGNRPADGARVGAASEVFSEDFIGSEGASDFLGLDTEFDNTPAPIAASGGDVAGDEVDYASQTGGVMAPMAAEMAEAAMAAAATATSTEISAEDEYLAEVDNSYVEGEYQGIEGDEYDEYGEEYELDGEEEGARRSPVLLLAGTAFALGLGAVALFVAGPKFFGKNEAPTEVASRPTPSQPKGPKGANGAADAAAAAAGAETATETEGEAAEGAGEPMEGSGEGLEPRPLEDFLNDPSRPTELVEPAAEGPAEDPGADSGASGLDAIVGGAGPELTETDPVETPVQPDPEVVAEVPDAAPEPTNDDLVYRRGDATDPLTLDQLIIQVSDRDSFLGSNAELVDLVWRGNAVPTEAIALPNRILTPAVGKVRVEMVTADIFEGRLFAVGDNKVWLDLDLGRIGLDGRGVESIENLQDDLPSRAPGDVVSDIATGRRVRASVPGGVIYGRVRSIREGQVTLITDSGARITLDAPDLEPVSERKSVVLKF